MPTLMDLMNMASGKPPMPGGRKKGKESDKILPSRNLLIGDPDKGTRVQIKEMFSKEYKGKIHEVDDGNAILVLVNNSEPHLHLIMMELNMPNLNGIRTLKILRTTFPKGELPIVVYGEKPTRDQIKEMLQLGVDDVLASPFTDLALLQKLRQHLGG